MLYSIIGVLAITVLLIENHDILLTRTDAFTTPVWTAYRRFLLSVLTYYVTDALWGVSKACKLGQALFLDTTLFFVAMAASVFCWTRYLATYLEEDNASIFLLGASLVVPVLVVMLAATNLFVPVLFTVDEACVYEPLPSRFVVLGMQIALLIIVSVYAVYYMTNHPEAQMDKYRMLALFGFLMAALLFAQLGFPTCPSTPPPTSWAAPCSMPTLSRTRWRLHG